jgi:hypothetical protein
MRMFDAEKAAREWTRSQQAMGCSGDMSRDEMTDHLLCEVERLTGEGMSEEAAFERAKAGLTGINPPNLRQKKAVVANALIWAALMLASALVLSGSTEDNTANFLLITVFIPLWWASDLMVKRFTAES